MRRAFAMLLLSGCLSEPSPPDGATHSWHELPGAGQPGPLHSPRMAWDGTRKHVVLHGGVNVDGAVRATWQLSDDNVWTEICPTTALPALYSPAFGFDPIGEQLVLAGGSSSADFAAPSAAVWTCSSTAPAATWVQHAVSLPRPVVGAQLVYDDVRGKLVLIGGNDQTGMYARESLVTSDLQAWQSLGVASPAAFGGAATNVTYDPQNHRILALKNYTAGFGTSVEATNELWSLPPSGDHWSLICGPSMRACAWDDRSEASLAHLGDSPSTFAVGGSGGAPRTELAGSWILDDNELVKTHDDPPARQRAAAAYDIVRKQLVVYGGNGTGCHGSGKNCDSTWVLE